MATTRRRDVESFKQLLWRWFEAEEYRREWSKFQAPGAKEAEAAATQALTAVLAAFEAEPNDASPKTQQPLPPQNSRDSDFP